MGGREGEGAGGRNGCFFSLFFFSFFFVVTKSGASSISVIHQPELITSESGVS